MTLDFKDTSQITSKQNAETFLNHSIDTICILPGKTFPTRIKKEIYTYSIENLGNKLLVSYKTVYGGRRCKFEFSKQLKLSAELVQMIGLLQGDGLTSLSTESARGSIVFCNGEFALLNYFMNGFKHMFSISKEDWSVRIQLNKKIINNYSDILKYWSKKLNIPVANFKNPMIRDLVAAEKGIIIISYYNKILSHFIYSLLSFIKKQAEKDKTIAVEYLKGVIATDGDIGIENGSVTRVRISGCNKVELKHYIKVLSSLNINSRITEKYRLQINGWKNLLKVAMHELIDAHPIKNEVFKNGFANHRKTKYFVRVKILKKKSLPITDYMHRFNHKNNTTAIRQLNRLMKYDLVGRYKDSVYKYYLTNEGNSLLQVIENEK